MSRGPRREAFRSKRSVRLSSFIYIYIYVVPVRGGLFFNCLARPAFAPSRPCCSPFQAVLPNCRLNPCRYTSARLLPPGQSPPDPLLFRPLLQPRPSGSAELPRTAALTANTRPYPYAPDLSGLPARPQSLRGRRHASAPLRPSPVVCRRVSSGYRVADGVPGVSPPDSVVSPERTGRVFGPNCFCGMIFAIPRKRK